MATYEELLQSAEQIRTNELPESNTHQLVGQHLKDQVEYSKNENSGLKTLIEIRNAETKFAINESIKENIIKSENARDFFGKIIQKVIVKWDKSKIEDVGQKWSIVYLYAQSQDPGGALDGRMTFARIENNSMVANGNINIYDYGYTKGYNGILEIKNAKPFGDGVAFDVTLDCVAIKLDTIYKLGNETTDPYAGKVYILPQLYVDTSILSSIDEINQDISEINEGLDKINQDYYISQIETISPDNVIEGKYIGSNGNLIPSAAFNVECFLVKKGDRIIISQEGGAGSSNMYALYNTNDLTEAGITSNNATYVSAKTIGTLTEVVDIPDNVQCIATTRYSLFQQYSVEKENKIPKLDSLESLEYEINSNKENIAELKEGLEEFQKIEFEGVDKNIDEYTTMTGQYIAANGDVLSLGAYNIKKYDVKSLDSYNISAPYNVGNSKAYAIYSSTELFDNTTAIIIGPTVSSSYEYNVRIPEGGKTLLVVEHSTSPVITTKVEYNTIVGNNQYKELKNLYSSITGFQIAKVIGEELYIGAKYNENNDILIHFSKCMFNDLMTFSKVGLSENSSVNPLPNPEREMDEVLNVASSDNIGPISISDGGWCGANHSYKEQGTVKTAENISFEFYADGRKLNDGNIATAKSIEIRVKNRIFNPTIPPEEGALILSSELCIEDVVYRVEKGNIFVSLSHTYTNGSPVSVGTYYGMQSMFSLDDAIMTPGGVYNDFGKVDEIVNFTKTNYPKFRRFIERNLSKDRYQSTYLLPYENGGHNLLPDSADIFLKSSGKCYHHILQGNEVQPGTIISWAGLYNWFTALQDDENALVYTAEMQGKTYLFIDVKKAMSETYIDMPPQLTGQEYVVVEKSDTITTVGELSAAKGLKIASNNAGSLVLSFEL